MQFLKRVLSFSFIILLTFSWMYGQSVGTKVKKFALTVGIGEYPIDSGWDVINSTNDSRLMKSLLQDFSYDRIFVLNDKDATKKNILDRFQKIYDLVSNGDHILLHFSCHGQQVVDRNGDEDDGLDEALIPYDARFWFEEGIYEGENHLIDDEIGAWIDKYRKKLGSTGQIIVLLDACHSGTANRGEGGCFIRGTSYVFGLDNYEISIKEKSEDIFRLEDSSQLARTLVLSACHNDETNTEFYSTSEKCYFGRLTYCFNEVVHNSSGSETAAALYEILFGKMMDLPMCIDLLSLQTPYMECSNSKSIFFL